MRYTPTDRHDDPLLGRVLDGRYRIDSAIASGGMATVYRGQDLRLERTVAIKVLDHKLATDQQLMARFQREARVAAQLSHPNLVAIHDQGSDDGITFLVMEFVPGRTLRAVIREEAPLAIDQALELMNAVLSGLTLVHQAQLVHRDIKPENILITPDGQVKLTDFGLVRTLDSDSQLTDMDGTLLGSVSYLAPERVTNTGLDARTDIYSVGIVLFEMLTGAKPHQGETPIAVAHRHVSYDVAAPSTIRAGIPDYVDALVLAAAAREPAWRPADARVLSRQLRRAAAAYAAGVPSDPELVLDLMPPRRAPHSADHQPLSDESTTELPAPAAQSHPGEAHPPTEEWQRPTPAPEHELTSVLATERVHRVQRQPAGPTTSLAEPPYPAARPRRSRRGWVVMLMVVLLTIGIGLSGWYLGVARYTVTPAIVNISAAKAQQRVEAAGLQYRTQESEYSETIPKGSVISSSPDAGEKIRKEGTVTAVISLGPERYTIPQLVGKKLKRATRALKRTNLTVGSVKEEYHEKIPAKAIISTDPVDGESVKRDTAVNLTVSKGPQPITIPDRTNRNAKKAITRFEKLGFSVSSSQDFSDTVPAGRIISQSPRQGQGFRGDQITLVISRGPQLIEVPSVRGQNLKSARSKLEALGFKVKVERTVFHVGANIVVSSSPAAGTSIAKGSTITLGIV